MKRITAVEALPDLRLKIAFDDGATGVVDMSDEPRKPIFASWGQPGRFALVRIAHGGRSLEWPDGIDLCADALYLEITGMKVEGLFPSWRREVTHA